MGAERLWVHNAEACERVGACRARRERHDFPGAKKRGCEDVDAQQ